MNDQPHNRFFFDAGARGALIGLAPGETFRFDSGFIAERLPDEGFSMSFDSNGDLALVALLNPDLTMRITSIRELNPVRVPRPAGSDSIRARLSPGEACLPSPNHGLVLHIIESYGDEPMQVTEFNPNDLEDERT